MRLLGRSPTEECRRMLAAPALNPGIQLLLTQLRLPAIASEGWKPANLNSKVHTCKGRQPCKELRERREHENRKPSGDLETKKSQQKAAWAWDF